MKSPIKKAFESIQKIITSKQQDDEKQYGKIPENNLQRLTECNKQLENSKSELLDMSVKLFAQTKKLEYSQNATNEFLNNNIKKFVQDLVEENLNKDTIIELLKEENEYLKKYYMTNMTILLPTKLIEYSNH